MKKLWILIAVFGLIGAGVGFYLYNKPVADLADVDSEVVIDARDLVQAFATDEAAANQQYLDKIIEVKGTVLTAATENGVTTVTLQTDDPLMSVFCEFNEELPSERIVEGAQILVRGQCTGMLMDVVLVRCVLLPS